MSEQLLIESLERYFNDEMLPEEKAYFEQMRQDNPELDQMVVTHKIFMGKMAEFAERQKLMTQLSSTHDHLLEKGAIAEDQKKISKGKIIQLWHRYKKNDRDCGLYCRSYSTHYQWSYIYIRPGQPSDD